MNLCWHRPKPHGKISVCRSCGVAVEECPCVTWSRSVNADCLLCSGSGWIATVRSEIARFKEYVFDRREA